MKNKLVVASLVLLLTVGGFIYFKTKNSSDRLVQIDNIQKEIIFCGHPYLAREVVIDGVNVVRRISDIMEEKDLCKTWSPIIYYDQPSVPVLNISKDQDELLRGVKNKETGKTEYYVTIHVARYVVILEDNSISLLDDFEGRFVYLSHFYT